MRRHGCAKTRNLSRGVIKRHLKFMGVRNTTLARYSLAAERLWAYSSFSVGHVPRSARELNLYLRVNTSITFFTMIALSHGAVIRCQFGASYLRGATAVTWRKLISVTGAELKMCDVLFSFPWRSCWGFCGFHAPLRSVARGGFVVVGFFVLTEYGCDSDPQSWPNHAVCGLWRCSISLACLQERQTQERG